MRRSASTTSAPSRTLRALVAVGASAALLSGCGGVAASSGDFTVTDQAVTDAALQFSEMTGSPAMLAGVATTLSRSEVISGVMAEHGIEISDEQVKERLSKEATELPEGGLAQGSIDLWRQIFEFEDAQQLDMDEQQVLMEDLQAALTGTEVDLNPRYAMTQENYPMLPSWIATTARQPETADAGIIPLG